MASGQGCFFSSEAVHDLVSLERHRPSGIGWAYHALLYVVCARLASCSASRARSALLRNDEVFYFRIYDVFLIIVPRLLIRLGR